MSAAAETAAGITLRAPRPAEWAACRMLLPETFAEPEGREYLLCVREQAPRLLGAVSFRRNGEALTGVRIHLVPAQRRQGFGRQIVERLRSGGAARLTGFVDVRQDPGAVGFCEALGFRRTKGLTTVEAEVRVFRNYVRGLLRKATLPPGLQAVPLMEAPLAEVARLHAEHIVHSGELNSWRLRFAEMPGLKHSRVAMLDGKVAGMLLWEPEGDVCVIRSLVAEAGAATRWVNLLLLTTVGELTRAGGIHRARFDFVDGNRKIRKAADRIGATVLREIAEYTA